MIDLKDTLQYFHISQNEKTREFWKLAYNESAPGGRFMLDFSHIEPNAWVSRNGAEWSLPWTVKIKDRFKMPIYDPAFKKSWQEITDERAADVARMIREENKKFSILYSGGIDSTLITVALLKNLSTLDAYLFLLSFPDLIYFLLIFLYLILIYVALYTNNIYIYYSYIIVLHYLHHLFFLFLNDATL